MRFIVIALFLCFMWSCQSTDKGSSSPTSQELMTDMMDQRRMISPEDLADFIINQDPSIKLVDVRDEEEFMDYSIPGSNMLPLSEIGEDTELLIDECDTRKLVFISNSGVLAEKAWMLSRLQGCKNGFILYGGLNEWTEKILQPTKPDEGDPASEWEMYNRRIGARNFFAGLSTEIEPTPFTAPQPKKTIAKVPKKKKVEEEEEGCS